MDNLTKHMTVTADMFMKQTDEHIKNLRSIIDRSLKARVFQAGKTNNTDEYHVIDNKYFPASLLPIVFEGFIKSIKGIEYYAYENHSPFEKMMGIIDFCATFEDMLNQVQYTSYWLWPSKSIDEVKSILESNEKMEPALAKLGYGITDLVNMAKHREYLNILFNDICLFECREVSVLAGFMFLNPFIALDYLANYAEDEKTSYTNLINKEDIGEIKEALVAEYRKKYHVDYYELMDEVKTNNAADLDKYQKLFSCHPGVSVK